MRIDPVAKTYAEALLLAAEGQGLLDDVSEEVSGIRALFTENRDLRLFLENPRLEVAAKKSALDAALSGQVSDLFRNFLKLVLDHGRQFILREILEAFGALYDAKAGIVRAEAVSAVPMSSEVVDSLKSSMATRLGKRVEVENRVDPSILGGLIVRFDGMVADGSLRRSLEEVGSRLRAQKFESELVHED